jgi:quinol monooxygenase YgiN
MRLSRRRFSVTAISAAALAACGSLARRTTMYGRLAHMTAAPGKRDALIAILLNGTQRMPGCLSYIVAQDSTNPDAIWITEVWDSQASHSASLSLPAVKAAISQARPLIAGFDKPIETVPVGGYGLHAAT